MFKNQFVHTSHSISKTFFYENSFLQYKAKNKSFEAIANHLLIIRNKSGGFQPVIIKISLNYKTMHFIFNIFGGEYRPYLIPKK